MVGKGLVGHPSTSSPIISPMNYGFSFLTQRSDLETLEAQGVKNGSKINLFLAKSAMEENSNENEPLNEALKSFLRPHFAEDDSKRILGNFKLVAFSVDC